MPAKFPVIDIAFHTNPDADPAAVARDMDLFEYPDCEQSRERATWRQIEGIRRKWVRRYPGRFTVFANLDQATADDADFSEKAVAQLRVDVKNGAIGSKIFSALGLVWKDKDGSLVHPDGPRFDPVWDPAAELHIPVQIHTSEPMSFFRSDRQIQRALTVAHSGSSRKDGYSGKSVTHQGLQDALESVIAKHPRTTFVCAHVGLHYEHLYTGARWLDQYPNVYFDTSASKKFLGRQPLTAHILLIKYQDRLLYGTDVPMPGQHKITPVKEVDQFEFRILETDDEYIDHIEPSAGLMWKLYGLHLPDGVLEKVYHLNAERAIPRRSEKGGGGFTEPRIDRAAAPLARAGNAPLSNLF